MRRTAVLRALTCIVFVSATVVACGGDDARAPAPAVGPTSTGVPTDENSFVPTDLRITEKVIAGILPSPAQTSSTLGTAPGVWVLSVGGLGQEFEHFDFRDSGMTASLAAWFMHALTPAPNETPEGMYLSLGSGRRLGATTTEMYVSLAFHDAPEHAEQTYQFLRREFGIQPGEEDEQETIADAVSMILPGVIVIRQKTVTAMMIAMGAEGPGVSAELREFARLLAQGIDEFVRTQGP